MKLLIALALLMGNGAPALAAADAADCDPGGTQLDINACAERDLQAADAHLNQVYRQVLARHAAGSVAQARVKAAQRLWIQLRDADLQARYPLGEQDNPRELYGSMYPMLYSRAKTELTAARTEYLRSQFLERSEYDL